MRVSTKPTSQRLSLTPRAFERCTEQHLRVSSSASASASAETALLLGMAAEAERGCDAAAAPPLLLPLLVVVVVGVAVVAATLADAGGCIPCTARSAALAQSWAEIHPGVTHSAYAYPTYDLTAHS